MEPSETTGRNDMKTTLFSLIFLISMAVSAADEKKIYSKAEFDKKVEQEVNRQVDLIKKKSISVLSKELLERERKIKEKEDTISTKFEQVKISESSLAKKIMEFEKNKRGILGCVEANQNNEKMRVKQLVEVISNMKPQKAADLLSVQDSNISVKLIEQIDPAKASKIFNLMEKEVSARIQKQYLNMQK
jgi:flagellar motility protein MotE (MotC chaperone)